MKMTNTILLIACQLIWLVPTTRAPAHANDGITPLSEILPGRPWTERRKEIEHRWLDLLGDFPEQAPELKPEMKQC